MKNEDFLSVTEKDMLYMYNIILSDSEFFSDNDDYYEGQFEKNNIILCPRNLDILRSKLKNNKTFIKELIGLGCYNIYFCSEELKKDYQFIKELCGIDGFILEYLPEYNNDKELVSIACLKEYMVLSHNDGETPNPFKFANDDLKSNKEFVMSLLEKNGYIYKHISDNLKNDKEVLLTAINNNQIFDDTCGSAQFLPYYLGYAGEELILDKDIALLAIRKYCFEYKYLHELLKCDLDIINEAYESFINYKYYPNSDLSMLFKVFPQEIRNNKKIFNMFYKYDRRVLFYLGEDLKKELNIDNKMLSAIMNIEFESISDIELNFEETGDYLYDIDDNNKNREIRYDGKINYDESYF